MYQDLSLLDTIFQRKITRSNGSDPRFDVFPRTTEEEEHRFDLLKRAYVDARYKMDEYTITKEELAYLAEKVNRLKSVTETLCKAKIEQIGLR